MTDEEIQAIKQNLYHIPQLEFFPKNLWNQLVPKLVLKEIGLEDKLIAREEVQVPCCIILKGAFEIRDPQKIQTEGKAEDTIPKLLPGSICGNFQALSDKRWKPVDVVAIEDNSSAAIFSADALISLMNEENSNAQFKALLAFLIEAITTFDQLSGHFRERLCRFFKERVFLPGFEIIQEGATPTSAFLVKEGECAIMSRQNPVYYQLQKKQELENRQLQSQPVQQGFMNKSISSQLTAAKTLRGYMSLSVNTFQLRTVNEKEWFGEEVLLMESNPNIKFEYSVVSKTKVVALEIAKENLKKFPANLLEWFRKNAKDKMAWHKKRKDELANSIGKIYHMDPMTNFLDEAFNQVSKKFPQANTQLTSQIHKQNFLNEEALQENRQSNKGGRIRPQSGILSSFNNLRSLMKAKKMSVQQRPTTAIQPSKMFSQTQRPFTGRDKIGLHLGSLGFGYKSAAQLGRVQSSKTQRMGAWLGGAATDIAKKNKFILDAASTFRMSYDNRVYFPTVKKKPYEPKKPVCEREQNKDAQIENMKKGIVQQYDTFKVGIMDIKAIDTNSNNRPPSPNPARIWASKHKINILARENENKMQTINQ